MFYTNYKTELSNKSPVEWEDISNTVNRHCVFFQTERQSVYSGNNITNCQQNNLTELGYSGTAKEMICELESGIYNYWSTYPEDLSFLVGNRETYERDFVSDYAEYEADSYTTDE
jgi:hypothetical protein